MGQKLYLVAVYFFAISRLPPKGDMGGTPSGPNPPRLNICINSYSGMNLDYIRIIRLQKLAFFNESAP